PGFPSPAIRYSTGPDGAGFLEKNDMIKIPPVSRRAVLHAQTPQPPDGGGVIGARRFSFETMIPYRRLPAQAGEAPKNRGPRRAIFSPRRGGFAVAFFAAGRYNEGK